MGRIVAIDYGMKRTGLAVTDSLQIIATALDTVESATALDFLARYFQKEAVDEVIIGMPKQLNNQDSEMAPAVRKWMDAFRQKFPEMKITPVDERFTSSIAQQTMLAGGMKKKDRQVKGNVDKISATLILQDYLTMKR
jgi:putative Holliday junction resolvase